MSKKLRLGELLLKEGILSRQQLEEALNAQLIYGGKLGTNLVEHGFVTEEFLTSFLSKQCNIPAVDAEKLENIPSEVIESVPRDLAERHKVIPFRRDKRRLDVALVDPTNLKAIDEVAFKTGLLTRPHVAPEVTILRCLERYYHIPTRRRYIHIEAEKEPAHLEVAAGLATSIETRPENGSLHAGGEASVQSHEVPIGLPDAFRATILYQLQRADEPRGFLRAGCLRRQRQQRPQEEIDRSHRGTKHHPIHSHHQTLSPGNASPEPGEFPDSGAI